MHFFSDQTRAFSYGEAALTTMKYICTLVKTSLSHDTKNRDDRWRLDVVLAGIANLAINQHNQQVFGIFEFLSLFALFFSQFIHSLSLVHGK